MRGAGEVNSPQLRQFAFVYFGVTCLVNWNNREPTVLSKVEPQSHRRKCVDCWVLKHVEERVALSPPGARKAPGGTHVSQRRPWPVRICTGPSKTT